MSKPWIGFVAAVGLAVAATAASASPITIAHDPVECVPGGRYSRISARGTPADEVATAEVQLRVKPEGAWYSVSMKAEGAEWSALLPQPTKSLDGFQYRIVMTSRALETASTAPARVRVSADGTDCPVPAQASVSSSIVVSVPAGAPVVPPVPPGFSPTGVVAAQPPAAPGKGKTLKILAGAGLAGGIAAAVALGSNSSPPEPDVPNFSFLGTLPNPGSVLSLSHTQLQVFVQMSREPTVPLTFNWRLEMQANAPILCTVVMHDVFREAQSPLFLTLSAPLTPSINCIERFDVDRSHLTIQVQDKTALDMVLSLPYHIEP
jgi:hypothetical protein